MDRNEIKSFVLEIMDKLSDIDECSEDMDIVEDLGLSSISVMELISMMEDRYKIRISSRDLSMVGTVGDLIELVAKKTA